MPTLRIDKTKCLQDGRCVDECPIYLIEMGEDGYPKIVPEAEELCINCGHCKAICSPGALYLNDESAQDCQMVDDSLHVSKEEVIEMFRTRRSIRKYEDKRVSRAELEQLLEISRWVPSTRNCQPVHWLVIESEKAMKDLMNMSVDWLKTHENFSRIAYRHERGEDVVFRGAPHLLVAYAHKDNWNPAIDCAIATASIEVALPSFGLGGCWAGIFLYAVRNNPAIVEYLKLPRRHDIYGALMLGYPTYEYNYIPSRGEVRASWF